MQDIITSFESKVENTIKEYSLATKKDKILVACSGGKDSTSVLYIFHRLGYNVEGLILDLHIGAWSDQNLNNILAFGKEHKIKINVVDIRKELGGSMCFLRESAQSKQKLSNCMVCGTIKKWLLNKKSRELGADKLATGHNLDDESETILMNLFKGDLKLCSGLGPKTEADKKGFVQRIKPLYPCSNKEVTEYAKAMEFPVLMKPCPCATGSFRKSIRLQLNNLEKNNPQVRENIVSSFIKLLPKIRKSYSSEPMKFCKHCGEPARNDVCKMCSLFSPNYNPI